MTVTRGTCHRTFGWYPVLIRLVRRAFLARVSLRTCGRAYTIEVQMLSLTQPLASSWADPSTTITGNTAILIGTSFVDLDGGQTADVLCLAAWTPTWVNGGHECLIAEVVSSADPPPPRTPDDPFDPPGERQMAQRNLNLVASSSRLLVFPFLAGNAKVLRTEEITVGVRRAPVDLLRPVLRSLGLDHLPAEMDQGKEFGVRPYVCGEQIDHVGKRELSLRLAPGRRQNLALAVRLLAGEPGSGGLFLIEERVAERIMGAGASWSS